jgi:hypothetical protein
VIHVRSDHVENGALPWFRYSPVRYGSNTIIAAANPCFVPRPFRPT